MIKVVVVAQSLISYFGDVQLKCDGIVGKRTREAYVRLPEKNRQVIARVLIEVTGDRTIVSKLGLLGSKGVSDMPNTEIVSVIRDACKEANFPLRTALTIFYIESGLNPRARSHSGAVGLGQLTRIAVKDIYPSASSAELADIIRRLEDPYINVPLSISVMKKNLLYLNRVGGFKYSYYDIPELYMAYNIGPTAAAKVLRGDFRSPDVARLVGYQRGLGPPSQYAENVRNRISKVSEKIETYV